MYYADIWTKFRVGEATRWWTDHRGSAIACLVAAKKLKVDKGVLKLRGAEVVALQEKPELDIVNLMGIDIYLKSVLKYAQPGEDLHGETVPRAIGSGEKVLAYPTDETYEDLGTLRAYKAAQKG